MTSVEELVGKNIKFEIGSGTYGMLQADQKWIEQKIEEAIFHKFFNYERFYELWGDERTEFLNNFKDDIVKPMMNKLDDTLETLFYFDKKKSLFFLK